VTTFETGIEFGQTYRDKGSGFTGKPLGVFFYEYGCTRVTLVAQVAEGSTAAPAEATFDEQALVDVTSGEAVESGAASGGPRPGPAPRPGG
jgi:hypothetical protein